MTHVFSITVLKTKQEELIKLIQDKNATYLEKLSYKMMYDDLADSIKLLDRAFFTENIDSASPVVLVDQISQHQISLTVDKETGRRMFVVDGFTNKINEVKMGESFPSNPNYLTPNEFKNVAHMLSLDYSNEALERVANTVKEYKEYDGLYDFVIGEEVITVDLDDMGGNTYEVSNELGIDVADSPFNSLEELVNYLKENGCHELYTIPEPTKEESNIWKQIKLPPEHLSTNHMYFAKYNTTQEKPYGELICIEGYLAREEGPARHFTISYEKVDYISFSKMQTVLYHLDCIYGIRKLKVKDYFELLCYYSNEHSLWSNDYARFYQSSEDTDADILKSLTEVKELSGLDLTDYFNEHKAELSIEVGEQQ